MMCNMYMDPNKNLFLFLPDDMTDMEIMTLCSVVLPDEESSVSGVKPVGILDLYNLHATFELDKMTPNEFGITIPPEQK
jgi:hypothetical protein